MKLFRDYTFKWWQVSLLKLYVMTIGLLIGAYFGDVVMQFKEILLGIFFILMVYFVYGMFVSKF